MSFANISKTLTSHICLMAGEFGKIMATWFC